MKRISIGFIIGGAAVLVLLLFTQRQWLPAIKNIFQPAPVLIEETPTVIREIKAIGQLVTITLFDEVVVDSIKLRPPTLSEKILRAGTPIPLSTLSRDQLVLIARGKVMAGVSLQKLHEAQTRITGDTLVLTLPPAEIIDVIVNPSDFDSFAETGSWTGAEVALVKAQAKRKLIQRALQQQVLDRARTQAVKVVQGIVGKGKIKVVVQ
jgi:hypothetical protein